jgi:hypothetical protein
MIREEYGRRKVELLVNSDKIAADRLSPYPFPPFCYHIFQSHYYSLHFFTKEKLSSAEGIKILARRATEEEIDEKSAEDVELFR